MLLYLTGGIENPFAFLFLVPVTVSATSLPLKWTLWLSGLAFACASYLAVDHMPLPWFANDKLALPDIYVAGMWTAIGILGALNRRHATGKGCVVQTSLFESGLMWVSNHVAAYGATGEVPPRQALRAEEYTLGDILTSVNTFIPLVALLA